MCGSGIRCLFWPRYPGWVKSRIRIRDDQPESYFRELRNQFFGSGMEKNQIRDPGWNTFGSGILTLVEVYRYMLSDTIPYHIRACMSSFDCPQGRTILVCGKNSLPLSSISLGSDPAPLQDYEVINRQAINEHFLSVYVKSLHHFTFCYLFISRCQFWWSTRTNSTRTSGI